MCSNKLSSPAVTQPLILFIKQITRTNNIPTCDTIWLLWALKVSKQYGFGEFRFHVNKKVHSCKGSHARLWFLSLKGKAGTNIFLVLQKSISHKFTAHDNMVSTPLTKGEIIKKQKQGKKKPYVMYTKNTGKTTNMDTFTGIMIN